MRTLSLMLVGILLAGGTNRSAGLTMLAMLAIYLGATYTLERKRKASIAVVAGIVMLVVGAKLLVEGANGIARIYGVSEAVIGLTVVAVGTSLPKLATAVIAAYRQHADVVLANVVGSNIFYILCIPRTHGTGRQSRLPHGSPWRTGP